MQYVKIGHTYDPLLRTLELNPKVKKSARRLLLRFLDFLISLLQLKQRVIGGMLRRLMDDQTVVTACCTQLPTTGICWSNCKRWMTIAHANLSLQTTALSTMNSNTNGPRTRRVTRFKLELSAVEAGEFYNLRIPIAAEGKIEDHGQRSTSYCFHCKQHRLSLHSMSIHRKCGVQRECRTCYALYRAKRKEAGDPRRCCVSAVIMHQQLSGTMITTHMKHGDGCANPAIKCSASQVILLTG